MGKLFLTISICLATTLNGLANRKTVTLAEAGTLSSMVADGEKYALDSLIVKGEINSSDIRFIRDLCGGGTSTWSHSKGKNLRFLDLSAARIVEGGGWYLKDEMEIEGGNPSEHLYIYAKTQTDTISRNLFMACSSLRSVSLPNSAKHISGNVFAGCNVDSVAIPDGVTTLDSDAFAMTKIKYIRIGSSVKDLDMSVLNPFTEEISVSEANPYYSADNGVLFDKTRTHLLRYPMAKKGDSYDCPPTVESIGDGAFFMNQNLHSVGLPEGLQSIGSGAFDGSTVASFSIPASVRTIGSHAFDQGYLWLRSVTCLSPDPAECADDAFPDWYDLSPGETSWDGMADVVLYVPKGCVDKYKEAPGFRRIKDIRESGSTTSIKTGTADKNITETARFAPDGTPIASPRKGLNIIKMSDGSTKKTFIR